MSNKVLSLEKAELICLKREMSVLSPSYLSIEGVICFCTQCTIFNRMQLRKYDVNVGDILGIKRIC